MTIVNWWCVEFNINHIGTWTIFDKFHDLFVKNYRVTNYVNDKLYLWFDWEHYRVFINTRPFWWDESVVSPEDAIQIMELMKVMKQ